MLPIILAAIGGYLIVDSQKEETFADGGLIAPNGKKSNLTTEQYKLVRTPAFKKWFGDWENDPEKASKVIDENGEPLVCYHSTQSDFNVFKEAKNTIGVYGKGFYFGNSKGYVSVYNRGENQKIISVFLKIINPIIIQNDVLPIGYEIYLDMMGGYDFQGNPLAASKGSSASFTIKAKSQNYDGVIAEVGYGDKEFVAFYPTQIKLADGTNTTFDSDNPDIRFKDGGYIKTDFNDYENDGLRKALLSLWDSFSNGQIGNYLDIGKENYILSDKDNLMVIFRDTNLGNFSDVEKVKIEHWLDNYFDEDKKPMIAKYLESYTIEQNKILIKIKSDLMYKKGGRTIAQTPAPKSDRIYGSKVNPKGSAASEKSASKIVLSKSITDTLQNKLSEFKEKHPNKQNITLSDLKAVYRRGAGAYSSSHRPTISGGKPNSRNAWAMARVNKFLLKAGGTKVKAAYVQDDDLMENGGEVFEKGGKFKQAYGGGYLEKIWELLDKEYVIGDEDYFETNLPIGNIYIEKKRFKDGTLKSYSLNLVKDNSVILNTDKISNLTKKQESILHNIIDSLENKFDLIASNGKPSKLNAKQYAIFDV